LARVRWRIGGEDREKVLAMAWAVTAKPAWGGGAGGHCSAFLASIGIRVASIHESSSRREKWDNKWKSVKLLILLSANQFLKGRFFEYCSSFPIISCKIRFALVRKWFWKEDCHGAGL